MIFSLCLFRCPFPFNFSFVFPKLSVLALPNAVIVLMRLLFLLIFVDLLSALVRGTYPVVEGSGSSPAQFLLRLFLPCPLQLVLCLSLV